MITNRKMELHNDIIELYSHGKNFTCGSLVYEYNTAIADQNSAIALLEEEYSKDMEVSKMGFEYGYSSFLDCLIGKSECYREPPEKEKFPTQVCVFILFCNYKNIFVLGEHAFFDKGRFIFPAFQAVDNFTTNRTLSLATRIHKLLEGEAYQRVYAAGLQLDSTRAVHLYEYWCLVFCLVNG